MNLLFYVPVSINHHRFLAIYLKCFDTMALELYRELYNLTSRSFKSRSGSKRHVTITSIGSNFLLRGVSNKLTELEGSSRRRLPPWTVTSSGFPTHPPLQFQSLDCRDIRDDSLPGKRGSISSSCLYHRELGSSSCLETQ